MSMHRVHQNQRNIHTIPAHPAAVSSQHATPRQASHTHTYRTFKYWCSHTVDDTISHRKPTNVSRCAHAQAHTRGYNNNLTAICFTVRSRNDWPVRTSRADLGPCSPMRDPSPPLSFTTTKRFSNSVVKLETSGHSSMEA